MPNIFYKKTALFTYNWDFSFDNQKASLHSMQGEAAWNWEEVSHYFESPHFFHIYFGPKTFFLIPNDNMTLEIKQTIRAILKNK
jgi:hypothetical protein